jgi:uncharacterized protein YbaP (TraB family)
MRFARFLPRAFAAIVLSCAAGFAAAQSACPPAAPGAESLRPEQLRADVRDRGFLWRLDKDGRSAWLYGTVHASRVEWVVPGPRVQEALAGSDVLALELDPSDPALPRAFMAPADPARMERVAGDLRPRIARLAQRACLPAGQLAGIRPMLQLTTLNLAEGRRDGFHPELAVDVVLWGLALRMDKKVLALETVESQMAALTPASEADERVLLEQGVRELESGEGGRQLARLLQAWAQGDEATLASYPQWCGCLDTPAEQRFLKQVNDDRNTQLAARLVALHAQGQRFFAAVGALHMTGPQGLPELLRAQGFEVRRIPFSSSR